MFKIMFSLNLQLHRRHARHQQTLQAPLMGKVTLAPASFLYLFFVVTIKVIVTVRTVNSIDHVKELKNKLVPRALSAAITSVLAVC